MKYIKRFNESNSEIKSICDSYGIKNYTINTDGSIDVAGDIDFFGQGLSKLPLRFNKINGHFGCSNNRLTTLEGCPKEVIGSFICDYNKLTTLEGAPKIVGRDFNCNNNKLTTLVSPEKIGGSFNCSDNLLTTLEGGPKEVVFSFNCSNNKLTSLEGAPEKVGNNFSCFYNLLTTLKGAPKKVGLHFYCQDTKLTSLEGAPEKVGGDFDCRNNNLRSVRGFTEDYEGNLFMFSNPIEEISSSIFKYIFNTDAGGGGNYGHHVRVGQFNTKIAHLLNEYDVISQDGKKIYRDSLEEVFNLLGEEMPKNLKFRNYEIH